MKLDLAAGETPDYQEPRETQGQFRFSNPCSVNFLLRRTTGIPGVSPWTERLRWADVAALPSKNTRNYTNLSVIFLTPAAQGFCSFLPWVAPFDGSLVQRYLTSTEDYPHR